MIRVTDRFTGRARRMRDSARRVQRSASRPTPPVKIDTGRALPGWLLQLLLAGVAVVAVIILDPPIIGRVLLIAGTAVVAVRPNAGTAAVFVGILGFFWMLFPTPPLSVSGFALLTLAVAVWVFGAALTAIPLRAEVELAVLKRPLLRWLVLAAIGDLFLLAGQLLSGGTGDPVLLGSIALGAAVVLAIAIWVILPRLSADDPDTGP